jgi:hypothetical protein
MKVENMGFTFTFKRILISATCLKFKPAKQMMYRVYIPVAKGEDEVCIFYENVKEKRLEWFTLPDKKTEEKVKAIASTLESIIFMPNA